MRAIVQLEQRKGKQKDKVPDSEFQTMTNKYEVDWKEKWLMLMPSIFNDNVFDDFFDFPF